MRKGLMILLATLALACGDSTGPEARTLRIGRYSYIGMDGAIQGTLTVTYASADSIAGAWAVNDATGAFFRADARLGTWNADAFVLYAYNARFTQTYSHRIWRTDAGTRCDAKLVPGAAFNCSLVYQGP